MDTRKTLTEKGKHNGWTVYKHEGVPGLALPHPSYWVAIKDGVRIVGDTKKEVIARADAEDATTPAMREHAARIAAILTKGANT